MFKLFSNFPELIYGFSEKSDGQMKAEAGELGQNLLNFFEQRHINPQKIVLPNLKHGENVKSVTSADGGNIIPNCDGLVSKNQNVILCITVADCFPIYLYDSEHKTVGLIHAGWRGSINRLIPNTIAAMDSNPKNILAGIGPGIGRCHFEVQKDILPQFANFPSAILKAKDKIFINLPEIIKIQFLLAGLTSENIEFCRQCTYCNSGKYFSFRRDKPKTVQAMVAYIGLT